MENEIHAEARSMDEKLQKHKGSNAVISLGHVFSYMTGDMVTQFTCGENPDLFEEPYFNPVWCV